MKQAKMAATLRCRWKSDCFEIYLRNTVKIRRQHAEALQVAVADNEFVAMGMVYLNLRENPRGTLTLVMMYALAT